MAIKCSLLGHKFTETDVEEEREEEGSEVVITVKEVETCERCGKTRVVSENKEVTSLATDEDGETESADTAGTEATASTSADATPDIDAAEDDAELLGEGDDDEEQTDEQADEQRDVDAMTDPEPTVDTGAEEMTAADDDAVILEDDEQDRDPGEWPEETTATEPADERSSAGEIDDPEPTEPVTEEWPDEYGYEEESSDGTSDAAWPEEGEGGDDGWTQTESLTESIDDARVERVDTGPDTALDGDFVCPECEFTTPVEESSLRAGDFCPECRRGTLEHQPKEQTRKE